ncbi:hypothetical protein QBC43DRAFT_300104 [Cladorrhinum sp. PSN259]|nr:hypothetical protein QBC43DRAFT_300104 [Cladorrhinum sp. PSN259]
MLKGLRARFSSNPKKKQTGPTQRSFCEAQAWPSGHPKQLVSQIVGRKHAKKTDALPLGPPAECQEWCRARFIPPGSSIMSGVDSGYCASSTCSPNASAMSSPQDEMMDVVTREEWQNYCHNLINTSERQGQALSPEPPVLSDPAILLSEGMDDFVDTSAAGCFPKELEQHPFLLAWRTLDFSYPAMTRPQVGSSFSFSQLSDSLAEITEQPEPDQEITTQDNKDDHPMVATDTAAVEPTHPSGEQDTLGRTYWGIDSETGFTQSHQHSAQADDETLKTPVSIPTLSFPDISTTTHHTATKDPSTETIIDDVTRRTPPLWDAISGRADELGKLPNRWEVLPALSPGWSAHSTVRVWQTTDLQQPLGLEEPTIDVSEDYDVPDTDLGEVSSLESSEHAFSFSSYESDVSCVGAALSTYQRQVVDSLMREFGALFCQKSGGGSGGVSASAGTSSAASQGSGRSSPRRTDTREESSGDRRLPNMPGSGGGNQGLTSIEENVGSIPIRKLACPYYKREPWKHNKHRSCTGPGWPAIHRVKEHITRVHPLPIYCRRCGDQFASDEDLDTHSQADQACEAKRFDKPEGFSKDQERLLKRKRKAEASDEEKWRAIYRILFPDDDENDIPSPYYDSEDAVGFDQYERYLRREVPRVVRRRLEISAAAIAVPVENELRAQLVDIIRSSQAEAFEGFRRMIGQTPSPTRPTAALVPSDSIASIMSAQDEPAIYLAPVAEESQQLGDDGMYLFDFSAFSPAPVVEEAFVMPDTLIPRPAMNGLLRGYSPPTAPDSGYGSTSGTLGGKKPMSSLEDWDGGTQLEGSSNWWMPTE